MSGIYGIVHDGHPSFENGDMNEAKVAVQRIVKIGERCDPFVAAVEALRSIVDHGRLERVPLLIDALRSITKKGKHKIK